MLADTDVTVNTNDDVDRAGNTTTVGDPSSFKAGTDTVDPSANVNTPPVTRSSPFGRSNNTTRSTICAELHDNDNHAPAPCQ